jgi:signal transduction histidine kinase
MELAITVSLLIAAGVLVAYAVVRERARRAEDTLRSISDLVSLDDQPRAKGAELVSRVRTVANRAEESHAAAETYGAALSRVRIGVAVVRPDGEIEYTNGAAQKLIDGTGEWAVLGTRVSLLGRSVAKAGTSERIDVDLHDPVRRVIVLRAYPIRIDRDRSDEVDAVAVYLEDRTAKRRLKAMRRDFVANASHELKTPLGALSLLAETLTYADDDEKRELLTGRLKAEADRMASLVDDILELARTESLVSKRTYVGTKELIVEAVDALSEMARQTEIELVRGPVDDIEIYADAKQVVSALRNLLDNAVTYTAAKGEPGMVTYSCRRDNGFACFVVTDTGIGIPSRYTDRVFERFFRIDQARSRSSGGTGLGLSIVRNVAKAHGGSVSVSSRVGEGTTMTFCLPATDGHLDEGQGR